MIKRFVFGEPAETGATITDITESEEKLPYFETREGGGFRYALSDRDIVYGLGESVRGINKRGWRYVSWNFDNCEHNEETSSLYGSHNFIIVSGRELFGVFFDNPGKMEFDIGYSHRNEMVITADNYDMNVYIITGKSEIGIVKQFRELIGRSYAAPKWAFGYGQSRWGYKSADDIRAVAKGYRENGIPLDMIYLDIDYMDGFKDFTVNNETCPDFKEFVSEMRKDNIRLIPIIDAGVKIEEGYGVYEEGVKENYFCKDESGKDFVAAVWPGRVHFPDVLNREARRWFGDKYSYLLDAGIEGFWNDMNEPAIFYTEERLKTSIDKINELSQRNIGIYDYFELNGIVGSLSSNFDDYKLFYHNMDGKKVRHDKVHNLYGYNMTRAAGEAFQRLVPEKRILMFSRSSYVGAHRYGGIWQGDNKSRWSHLLMNMQMTASLNMTGFLYTGADLGGFGCDTTEDLMLRWLQFALFTPIMRNHSAIGTREQEVYKFDNMKSCKKMIEIRYALIPYIYSEYMKAVLRNDMMFKPLGFEFGDGVSRGVEDQILLGEEVMLAPIYVQNAEGRYVWLPEEMIMVKMRAPDDYETAVIPSGHHYIHVGLDELVFFIRKGKAIPVCSGGKCVQDINVNSIKLIGYKNTKYELYDDDGATADISESNLKIII